MSKLLKIYVGPTAVGKTSYSIDEALRYNSPIISCDSRQVYKEMTIGTAVPTDEELAKVKHYFIHTQSVTDLYSAGQYEVDALELINSLFDNGHDVLIMSGGSGFYVDALCKGLSDMPKTDLELRKSLMKRLEEEGLEDLQRELKKKDPEAYSKMDSSNIQRVVRALEVCILSGKRFSDFKAEPKSRNFEVQKICLNRSREELYDRINFRVDKMIEEGLLKEAESLLGYRNYTAMQTVGYQELFDYFDGKISLDKAVELIKQHTRNYAKRQLTWWRRDKEVQWINIK